MKSIALVLLLVAPAAFAAPLGTPGEVRAALAREGAQAFFARLDEHDADRLFARIGSGQAAWVALAPALATGADAANAEGLGIALADALPRNAAAVLAVVDPHEGDGPTLAVSRVCGIPFVDAVPVGYKARALRAVRAVKAPRLQAARARCIAALTRSSPAPGA